MLSAIVKFINHYGCIYPDVGYFVKDLDIRNDPDTLLPETNRYVATNAYGEQKFGFGNIMVVGFVLKECVGGKILS